MEFAQGGCFVNLGWGGTQKYLQSSNSKLKDKLYFSSTPGRSYFNWGWNYVVSNSSLNKEISFLFSIFATLPKNATEAVSVQDGFFDPFQTEHYESECIEKVYGKKFLLEHKKALVDAIPDFYISGRSSYIRHLEENISLAMKGRISTKEALDFTAQSWEETTNQLDRLSQIEQWNFFKEYY